MAKEKVKLLYVDIFEAKPNPMFSEEQRASVRFLCYNAAVRCAECGRKSKHHWTVLFSFEAHRMSAFQTIRSGKVHLPFTPVCRAHVLGPGHWKNGRKVEKKGAQEHIPEWSGARTLADV